MTRNHKIVYLITSAQINGGFSVISLHLGRTHNVLKHKVTFSIFASQSYLVNDVALVDLCVLLWDTRFAKCGLRPCHHLKLRNRFTQKLSLTCNRVSLLKYGLSGLIKLDVHKSEFLMFHQSNYFSLFRLCYNLTNTDSIQII